MGRAILELEKTTVTTAAPLEIIKMNSSEQNNERRITFFLSGFNQVFLVYLLLNIIFSIGLEGIADSISISDDIVSADYDFEIKTAMERTKDNSSFMAGMVALSFSAVIFVSVDKALQKWISL